MRITVFTMLIAAAVALIAASPAHAQDRVALVIGNAEYANVPVLRNTINDAEAVGKTFERLGFEVTFVTDQSYGDLRRGLAAFSAKAERSKIAVVFYAGHGIELENNNYLVPIDAALKTDRAVEFEALPLDMVTGAVDGASELRLVILDACRDNPFLVQMASRGGSRSIGRGLARVEPASNTLIAYAAKEGTIAADGDDEHSPFTTALLEYLETPNLDVQIMFRKIRDEVLKRTGGVQEPYTYGSLSGDEIYLNEAVSVGPDERPELGDSAEQVLWDAVLRNGKLAAFRRYLEEFPNGRFVNEARFMVDILTSKPEEADTNVAVDKPQPATKPQAPQEEPKTAHNTTGAAGTGLDAAEQAARNRNPPILQCDRLAGDPLDGSRVTGGVAWRAIDTGAAIEACREAGRQYPEALRIRYQLARALHKGGHQDEAAGLYEELVERGYAIAGVNLGAIFIESKGAKGSYARARSLLEGPARDGNANAQFYLGYIYSEGLGGAKDYRQALDYFQRSADQDHAGAAGKLGLMYYRGQGVKRDYRQARTWFERAAEGGFSEAMFNLAIVYGRGDGVAKNMSTSADWMYKALVHGNAAAIKAMTTNAGGTTTEFRRQLQVQLRNDGYYHGAIDGQFGRGTQQAITKLVESTK